MVKRFRFWLLVLLGLAACAPESTLTPPPAALTAAVQLQTEAALPSATPEERVIVPTARQTQTRPAPWLEATQPAWRTGAGWRPVAPLGSPTPQPTLAAHTFELPPVIFSLTYDRYPVPEPPELILYGNGLLVRSNYRRRFGFDYLPTARVLEVPEVCAILNTIDQLGFFDYDHRVYRDPFVGQESVEIKVNAWRSHQVEAARLWEWVYDTVNWGRIECDSNLEDCTGTPPVVLPALANTFRLLDSFPAVDFEEIDTDGWLVWLLEAPKTARGLRWPFEDPSLGDLYEQIGSDGLGVRPALVTDPAVLNRWPGRVDNQVYTDGEQTFMVYSRPLWPYENPLTGRINPRSGDVNVRGDYLVCTPADGMLPLP